MGEKFGANPVTGTASMTVPIATSPGRSGFGPQLSLAYDSGAGNGVFGFGWSLSLPSITRKTDRGLPRYRDREESDVFILSGSEDLVRVAGPDDTTTAPGYTIRRYRPRVEGLFARIERWTTETIAAGIPAAPDVHWRSISRDNVLTVYGKDMRSRIQDPADPGRVFMWLIAESRDDKGNGVIYDYKPEDGTGVDLRDAHERNRGPLTDVRRTANRYVKRIRFGNRAPFIDANGNRPRRLTDAQIAAAGWMFDVVFDYGEHDGGHPTPADAGPWALRADPFSSYRATFEVRTTRICQRVLMFHHIPDLPTGEPGYDGLVSSTDFTYSYEDDPTSTRNPVYTFMSAMSHHGYRLDGASYVKRSMPPLEFEYSEATVDDTLRVVDPAMIDDAPTGLEGSTWQWIDLHGEGAPGMFTEQGDAWFYKRNLSPLQTSAVAFSAAEVVATRPNVGLAGGQAQFMDLAGDGGTDVALLDGSGGGVFEHDDAEAWAAFRPFASQLTRDFRDANLRLVDLDGDGHADVLITQDDAFVWHASLAEDGFGPAARVPMSRDEELGPRLVFATSDEAIHLADMSGDGLADLVRIRRHDVSYWPNLGYGRFGRKVTMDHPPRLDRANRFAPARLRLADIDGSGSTDLIYLDSGGARLYFNQSGNGWSDPQVLSSLPRLDDVGTVMTADLLGNGTASLVWSSPLPGDASRPMRYVSLMGLQKPHLLIRAANNLGAETRIRYSTSTKFYLQDRLDGRPWLTRLPFPVHVVERVETHDHISRNRFVTRLAYHHGYFDRAEREFRGFARVDRWDTEELAALTPTGELGPPSNHDPASHVPPVRTKTWFHTGVDLGRDGVSSFLEGEYYREPDLTDAQAQALLLPDTVLPVGLTIDEAREAHRALKGSMLRQEVYAIDGSWKEPHPYSVTQQNFAVRREEADVGGHAVFFVHPRETLSYHYERAFALDPTDPEPDSLKKRKLFDPRVAHEINIEVDRYGSILRSAAIGYGRRRPDPTLPTQSDRDKQSQMLITYTRTRLTNAIDDVAAFPDDYRTPMPAEVRTWDVTGVDPVIASQRFAFGQWAANGFALPDGLSEIPYQQAAPSGAARRRMIRHLRTLYRPDDLGSAANDPLALLALGDLERQGIPGETYTLAFTSALLADVFLRDGLALIPNPGAVVGGATRGGYVVSQDLKADGRFPVADPDDTWWVPSGRAFLSPGAGDTAAQERAYARAHFFLPHRARDPFHSSLSSTERSAKYDPYDLLVVETRDQAGNHVTVGERLSNGSIDHSRPGNDYRVLQPYRVMDPNRNRTELAFDALGLVVGMAVMGKPGENVGDSLDGFLADLDESVILSYLAYPLAAGQAVLGRATSRMVYDVLSYARTKGLPHPQPTAVVSVAREIHDSDLQAGQISPLRHTMCYSDGFGREIQRKARAEQGSIINGGPVVSPRWVGTGWKIFNNKGKPVRQYEPFFSATHSFEFGVQVGVSPIVFYDPVERVVATLHPNHSYEKVRFDPWRQENWDANDTVLDDPRTDEDVAGIASRYFAAQPVSPPTPPWETWYVQRAAGAKGPWPQSATAKAAVHARTPTRVDLDSLGRPFVTFSDAGPDPVNPAQHALIATRVDLDIEGNQRSVRDAVEQAGDPLGRVVMRTTFDMLGSPLSQASMEAGTRWTVMDVAGSPIRAWDSRGHSFVTEYDGMRRPVRSIVTGADPADPGAPLTSQRLIYGEQHPDAEVRNLRGMLYLQLDEAGAVGTESRDYKGNPLDASRRVVSDYKDSTDWHSVDSLLPTDLAAPLDLVALDAAVSPLVEPETFTSSTTYDALNRPVLLTTPHTATMQRNVVRPSYNEANLLERLDVNLRNATASGVPVWTPFVLQVDYDAKGRRRRIDYGNGVTTSYEYDEETSQLKRLRTRRDQVVFPTDCPTLPPNEWPGCGLQDLHYTCDAAGNITHVQDDAQQTVYFRNHRVDPSTDYTYDSLYRLTEATGREHLGQAGGAPVPHSFQDGSRSGIPWSANDGQAMGTYIETYMYDLVGNFLEMKHVGSDPANAGWTRSYAYLETSLLEQGGGGAPTKTSNRLTSTTFGALLAERYVYDAHGNTIRMPHLGGVHPTPNVMWDYRDQIHELNLGGGGTIYCVYDGAGERVRKVWEKSANLVEERLYLGGFEIYRRRQGANRLERETLQVFDDKRRIALVETRTTDTAGVDQALGQVTRYQVDSHIGSSVLELDELAAIISYEEYSPYGSTTYQAVRSATETPKRYRFTAQERDDGSGLYYHGARYFLPWLGRWASCDAIGLNDGPDRYVYARSNPIAYRDPSGLSCDPSISSCMPDPPTEINFTAGEIRRVPFALHVDEAEAVKGHLAGGVAGSPSDPANKQLLDSRTNVQSKSNFVSNAPRNERPPVSIAQSPQEAANRLITGRLSEVDEVRDIADRATASTRPGLRTNASLRSGMRSDPAVRGAFSSIGVDPDTLSLQSPEHAPQFSSAPSVNMSSVDADVDPATGRVVPGPNTSAALERRAERLQSSTNSTAATSGNASSSSTSNASGVSSRSSGSARPISTLNTAGNTAAGLTRAVVPGVVEAEAALVSGAYVASGYTATAPLVTPLLTAAEAVPIVGGGLVAGAVGGNLVEAGARELGASDEVAQGSGAVGAILTGAGVGALIGSPTGIGAPVGAVIGGVVGLGGYVLSKWL
jgi:RHS repeat-associated protein